MRLPHKVTRKRKRLFGSQAAHAAYLGVSRATVARIEADPLPDRLVVYLRSLGYRVTFNPEYKEEA